MNINVIASGSSGNAYIIYDGVTSLLLDCGISYKRIQQGSGFRMSNISGCLITHEHQDHSKAAHELIKRGTDIYSSQGTIAACKLYGHRVHVIKELKRFEIASYNILPFDVEHDAADPLGFLISSTVTDETLLYFTDTYYLKYKFSGVTHIMAEANYSIGILQENIDNGSMGVRKARLLESHMSIEHLIDMLKANDLTRLQQIYLIHMSNDNSNEKEFKEAIQRVTGAEVYTC